MNYCKDCELRQPTEKHGDLDEWLCPSEKCWTFDSHPACAVFSAKKRTCGECVNPFWRGDDGLCRSHPAVRKGCKPVAIWREHKECDNFKGEA